MLGGPSRTTVLAAELFLLVFPVGHLLVFSVGGAVATGADLALLLLLAAGAFDLVAGHRLLPAVAGAWAPASRPPSSEVPPRRFLAGVLTLALLGGWIGLSGLWGFHPKYAIAKGAGTVALALGAAVLATSGIGWRRAVDAWLGGTALALVLTVVLAFFPGGLRQRMAYGGTGVLGLPFERVSGPFLHPDMLGDYLVVSAVLLWARWPEYSGTARRLAVGLAAAIATFLFLTVSTAWVSAGVILVIAGCSRSVRRSLRPWLGVGGALLAGATLVGILVPLDVHGAGLHIVTGGIRPGIWRGSLDALVTAPVAGVGASPFLARTADPLLGGAEMLWNAHNAALSILGQFGLVGFGLAAAGVWMVVVGSVGKEAGPSSRRRTALRLALVAVAVDALFMSSEDLRHVWVLFGMAGLAATPAAADRPPGPSAP